MTQKTNDSDESKQNKSNKSQATNKVANGFKGLLGWIVDNVLPIVAFLAIAGLAVLGGMQLLGHLSHETKLVVSIVVVATFAALSFGEKR